MLSLTYIYLTSWLVFIKGEQFNMDIYLSDLAVCEHCSRICEQSYKEYNGETFCHYEIESKDKTQSEVFGCYIDVIKENKESKWQ